MAQINKKTNLKTKQTKKTNLRIEKTIEQKSNKNKSDSKTQHKKRI